MVVVGPDGKPVPDVVVYATYESNAPRRPPGPAIMDQQDTRFVPHILPVQVGTAVEFPNSDVVAHHVYSFSKPNDFALPLYKGNPHQPVRFDHDGIVTLGCNIHDHMLAYIVVVDTDVFGMTGTDGRSILDLDDSAANITVHIWSPRLRDAELSQAAPDGAAVIRFELARKLRPAHNPEAEGVQWSEY